MKNTFKEASFLETCFAQCIEAENKMKNKNEDFAFKCPVYYTAISFFSVSYGPIICIILALNENKLLAFFPTILAQTF